MMAPSVGAAQPKAVVLNATFFNSLSAIRALGEAGIHVVGASYDPNNYAAKSRYISEYLPIPDLRKDPEGLLTALLEYGRKQESKPVLIPTHDKSLVFTDVHQDELREFFLLSLPRPKGLTEALVEKSTLYPMAEQHGVRVPTTVDINDPELLALAAQKIGYPLIVKPSNSVDFVAKHHKKVIQCGDEMELIAARDLLLASGFAGFAQQLVKGDDERMSLFDAFVQQDGTISHVFTGQKLRQWPINFGASCLMQQKPQADLVELGTKFFRDIGWRGFAEIEFKREADTGDIYLIEINARTTNFDACIRKSGFAAALLTYQDLCNLPLTPSRAIITENLGTGFEFRRESRAAAQKYLEVDQWSAEHLKQQRAGLDIAYAIWDPKDPLPYLTFAADRIKRTLAYRIKKYRKSS